DNRQAWDLHSDGTYVQRNPGYDPIISTHKKLLRDPWGLDRADSRYTTMEIRGITPPNVSSQPEPHVPNASGHANGSGKKSKRSKRH
ncbi:MAG: hypothetical protein ABIT38_23615, partial [Gemmatimonadaceae bacterium]